MVGYAVNNSGLVVGAALDASGAPVRSFRFQDGQTSELVTVSGDVDPAIATNLNDAGVAVGFGGHNGEVAVLFTDGQAIDLNERVNQRVSSALAVNASGQIVASGNLGVGLGDHAALIDGNTIIDLNDVIDQSGWQLFTPYDINDRGQIVGSGRFNGADHAFVLTPMQGPTPSPIPLPAGGKAGALLLAFVTLASTRPWRW
jgi:probable HAF family extracellular repeat protein